MFEHFYAWKIVTYSKMGQKGKIVQNGISLYIACLACPIPVIPLPIVLNMMKYEKFKVFEYLETPKGILVI